MEGTAAEEKTRKTFAAPVAAILSALGSLACCLPMAFLAAFGAASAGAVFSALRPWLLIISAGLLGVGFVQLYREGKSCRRRSRASVVIFWMAVGIFLLMLFFPQLIAGFLAGHGNL